MIRFAHGDIFAQPAEAIVNPVNCIGVAGAGLARQFSDDGRNRLQRCPAATAGYQLFRQQALAEALADSGKYDLVVTSVAYDERNETLIGSMRGAGISDFREDWGPLFTGKARFASFSHQAWIGWVRENDVDALWSDWLEWVVERYEFAE